MFWLLDVHKFVTFLISINCNGSMASTASSVKQRKLNDLRVVDLQRELRTFNVSYDKKELKGSLLEKLRQVNFYHLFNQY